MAKLSYGPGNWHVMSSNGPSTRALDFYSTCYSTVHGKETIRSEKVPRHRGTGYEANFRPTVYYSKQVDMIDNPAIRYNEPYASPKKKCKLSYRPQQSAIKGQLFNCDQRIFYAFHCTQGQRTASCSSSPRFIRIFD